MSKNKKSFGDLDMDLPDRSALLELINHIPASIIKNNEIESHNTGVYVQNIPVDPVTGLCSLDHKRAEDLGYMKLDFLNNSAYESIKSNEHLDDLLSKEPMWDLLEHEEVVKNLFQIHAHFDVVSKMKPKSIHELAVVLALIRPGKYHLIGRSWADIEKEIWLRDSTGYIFRKSHAVAYSMIIVMQLNLLVENLD